MKDVQTGNKIFIALFVAMAIVNLLFAIIGKETALHVNVAILFVGWAFQIFSTDTWRARALKAEANR